MLSNLHKLRKWLPWYVAGVVTIELILIASGIK